jgi:hypothetical protein
MVRWQIPLCAGRHVCVDPRVKIFCLAFVLESTHENTEDTKEAENVNVSLVDLLVKCSHEQITAKQH